MFEKLFKRFTKKQIKKEVSILNKVIEGTSGTKEFVVEAGSGKLLLIDIETGNFRYEKEREVKFNKLFELKDKFGDVVETNLQLIK